MNLKDAIKSVNGVTVTDSDTSSVYNTTNAWDDSISYDWGAVYHVSKDRCEAYKINTLMVVLHFSCSVTI